MMRPAPPSAHGAPWRIERPAGAGGHRLVAALEDVEQLPALRDAKAQLVQMLAGEDPPLAEVVLLIETDPALTLAVLREARASDLPAAVRTLGWPRLRALVEALPTFDFFDRSRLLSREAARLRVHGIAVQRAAQQIRDELELGVSNRL